MGAAPSVRLSDDNGYLVVAPGVEARDYKLDSPVADAAATLALALDSGGGGRFVVKTLPAGGVGDVSGPAGATANAIARFDGASGKAIKASSVTLDDAGALGVPAGGGIQFDQSAMGRNTSQVFGGWWSYQVPAAQSFSGPWAANVVGVAWSAERTSNIASISIAGMTPPPINNGAAPAPITALVQMPLFSDTAPVTTRSGLLKVLSGGVYRTGSWYYDHATRLLTIRPTEDPTSVFPVGSTGATGWTESFTIQWLV